MTYFAVMIEANNLLIQSDALEEQVQGCFCTRYLEANDIDAAIALAKRIVGDELEAQGITFPVDKLTVESVEQVTVLPDAESSLGKGFTFYSED